MAARARGADTQRHMLITNQETGIMTYTNVYGMRAYKCEVNKINNNVSRTRLCCLHMRETRCFACNANFYPVPYQVSY